MDENQGEGFSLAQEAAIAAAIAGASPEEATRILIEMERSLDPANYAAPPDDQIPLSAYEDHPTDASEPTKKPNGKHPPRLKVVNGGNVPQHLADDDPDLPPQFSESGMARAWVEKHGEDWRYTARWKAWHRWDGTTWVLDERNNITWTIDEHCREQQAIAAELTPTQKNRICTIKNFWAINALAGANPKCAITPDQWDANPMMLGTPDGVIDLTTGKLIEAERDQLISKKTSVSPQQGPHPWWDSVLARAHKGDAAVAAFIQRWCGYMLTGDTREERFLFVHGAGGGGKSKFLTPLVEIMGDYCRTAKIESFTAKERAEHSEEVARLAGARLVTASETEDGSRWNEGRIKQLTGRDKIAARHMHQSTFEFQPQFKLLFIGNHKPALRSVGEEMRRRIDLLEWSGSIPDEERVLDLPVKLQQEYPAILAWMVQGCLLWQEQGLGRPMTIMSATDGYLSAEDTIGAWMDDCIRVENQDITTLVGDLYRSFKAWAEKQGEYVWSQKRFSGKLEDKGLTRHRDTKGRYFRGVSLKDNF